MDTTVLLSGILIGATIALIIWLGLITRRQIQALIPQPKQPETKPAVNYVTFQEDGILERNRLGRLLVFILWIAFCSTVPASTLALLAIRWNMPINIGMFAGLLAGTALIFATLHKFLVHVEALSAFVTVDQLRTLFGAKDAYVTYGPGLHLSYPWEERSADNNVFLTEVSEPFSTVIQLKDDKITVTGSVRLRPALELSVPFLSGVAAAAEDITDLIRAFILKKLGSMSADRARRVAHDLNEALRDEFVINAEKESEFEERFGIIVGDVTIAKIEVSEDLQKTLSGLAEAKAISKGMVSMLGYSSAKAVREAVAEGRLTHDDLDRARKEFLAATQNIEMTHGSQDINVKVAGIDPETVRPLANAVATIATALGGRSRPRQNRTGRGNNQQRQNQP